MKFAGITLLLFVFALSVAAQQQTALPSASTGISFKAFDLNDQALDTATLKGKIVVVNLWYINCPNCVEEISMLNKLVDEYKDNPDVVFLGLSASRKTDLEGFLKKYPFSYRIIPNATPIILSTFGTPDKNGQVYVPFPMHYVLDRGGNIVVKTEGVKGVGAVRKELLNQMARKTAAGN